ncbi:MAG: flagellar export chaperone FliS [Vampirovibrionales bacterium]
MTYRAMIPELFQPEETPSHSPASSRRVPTTASPSVEQTSLTTGHLAQARAMYEEEQILNASPHQLLLMLFDGAIKAVLLSKKAFETKTFELSAKELIRAQRILRELMDSLDFEVAPDIAKNLYSIYEYLHYQLVQANVNHDTTLLDEVLWHLRTLRKTWAEASQKASQERTITVESPPDASPTLHRGTQRDPRDTTIANRGFQHTLEEAQSRTSYEA